MENVKSQLKTVKINDFRCLTEVTLDLDNVVALRGNNESGKTSIIKALELLVLGGTNAGKNIRSGCRDFRIAGYVEDQDVTVVRTARGYKIYNGNVIDKEVEKQSEPVTVISALTSNETPEAVAKIFNAHRNSVTGGMLGSRGYASMVPFVQTSAAENYSIVSEEMGVKPFRDASYGGLLEAGRFANKAKALSVQLEDLQAQKVRAEGAVVKAKEMETLLGDRNALYDAVISSLESLTKIEEIEQEMQGKPVTEAPAAIDEMLVSAIAKVRAAASELKAAKKALEDLGDANKEAPAQIDMELLMAVTSVRESATKRKNCKETLANAESALSEIKNEIAQYGGDIEICPVCGAVLVDGRCQE